MRLPSLMSLIKESLSHEQQAVQLYQELLTTVDGKSIYIEEYSREMIKAEEIHQLEIGKMLKDFAS